MKAFKKLLTLLFAAVLGTGAVLGLTACDKDDVIYVDTNAYFAPFEYYDANMNIVGVDVDIMKQVGEKLNKKVKFENTDFDVIIDNVSKGKKYDCGAAGITITDARKEKVDFSDPYFTSVQYVIYKSGTQLAGGTDNGTEYVLWSALGGKKVGVQRDTTGDLYVGDEIDGGVLDGTNAELTRYDNAQLAVDAIGAQKVDVVVVDKLPAQYIVAHNANYVCKALYYDAYHDDDTNEDVPASPTEEQYAICVTKGKTELLKAINEVLATLGENGINALVSKHLGLGD